MLIMKDFECSECGTVTEKLVPSESTSIECPTCLCSAHQLMGAPTVKLEGITGSFPGAHHKWAKIREDNARIKANRH